MSKIVHVYFFYLRCHRLISAFPLRYTEEDVESPQKSESEHNCFFFIVNKAINVL